MWHGSLARSRLSVHGDLLVCAVAMSRGWVEVLLSSVDVRRFVFCVAV